MTTIQQPPDGNFRVFTMGHRGTHQRFLFVCSLCRTLRKFHTTDGLGDHMRGYHKTEPVPPAAVTDALNAIAKAHTEEPATEEPVSCVGHITHNVTKGGAE